MVGFMLAAALAATSSGCAQQTAQLESLITHARIEPRDVEAVISVGQLRRKQGAEIVPLSFLCPSVDEAARELMDEPRTRAQLASAHTSARHYVITAMALWKAADDVQTGRASASPHERQVLDLYLTHRSELDSLIYGE